jgi:4-hydroxybenzoate polyprenyltransferase
MATQTELARSRSLVASLESFFFPRIRKFLWIASGLLSAACFAVPVMGLIAFGTANDVAASFVTAVVSACLFGVTSLWHFGPESA